jgi:hypothetical protein
MAKKKTTSPVAGRDVSKREARAAAKVMVTVNKRLGKTTPKWVKALADERSS